jgi:hypothetical protein
LIAWLLAELEKSPTSLFRERTLREKSKDQFEKLKRQRLLVYARTDDDIETYPCNLPCSRTCPMEVVEMDDQLWAICPEDAEIDPIPLSGGETSKYRLSLEALAEKFRETNLLTGRPSKLDQCLLYLGEAHSGGFTLAVILGLFPTARIAFKTLLALPSLVSGRPDRYLVVLPSLKITDQADLIRLERLDIFPVKLDEKDPFKIDLSPALKKAAEKPVEITLTPKEEKEFALHQFKSRLPIGITGDVEKRATNIIRVGTTEIKLGNASFTLFLRLVVELFKGGDGCVYKGDPTYGGGLIEEGYLNPAGVDQAIQRLREKFASALKDLPSNKFIEIHRSKHLRLSTHPAYISFNKDKLLNHEEEKIRRCANQLP